MRGPDTGEASSLGLDRRSKVIATHGLLLLTTGSASFRFVARQGFVQ